MKRGLLNLCCITVSLIVILAAVFASTAEPENNRTLAFPGAEGYGAYTTGGRGGTVYEVTNLNDFGPGSLRDAISKGNRIIVFKVSGTIKLTSTLKLNASNITIAGQTAPGDGICIKGYPVTIGGSNIIIRYIRFRLGYDNKLKSDSADVNDAENIIIDHCSFSWGVDECVSIYGNKNVTVQWNMIGEGLNVVNHSCGGLWGANSTYHHNLFYSNKTRNPKLAYLDPAGVADYRNNVIYNWGEMSVYTGTAGNINMVNNYYKPGPSTKSEAKNIVVQVDDGIHLYADGNYMEGNADIIADNWDGGIDGTCTKLDEPLKAAEITMQTAEEAYKLVLADVGATLPKRDAVDARVIDEVTNGTGKIINSPDEVGGWAELNSTEPPADSDHDGMPDSWEKAKKLNAEDASDAGSDMNGDGYANIEEYINSFVNTKSESLHTDNVKTVLLVVIPSVILIVAIVFMFMKVKGKKKAENV